ncbi:MULTISPECIES: hypothetical protein [Muribaculaceae]|uniref:Uncharacterized protein n=2 Tax=Muribaculaceae TaxID=2005473 RepID=A0A4Z0V2R6_9BACT|nr:MULTISPECIES: hypothetical protein [Muribaculaceae]QCD37158.1 hypothetical protein E7746_14555 [Muribaculum gordoncarteri]TGG35082.1 hypothetical protein EZ315_15465 [Duncaniella freteri]
MTKTEIDFERDFYTLVKNSDLGKEIRGSVYRSGMRPTNAKSEDLIVKFLAGTDEQVQGGIMLIHVYVPDIANNDGRKVEDKARVGVLESAIIAFVKNCEDTEYLIRCDGLPKSTELPEEIEQHLIVTRLKFQRLTQ